MASRKAGESSCSNSPVPCPICGKSFEKHVVEEHVNKCLFLNTSENNKLKRSSSLLSNISPKRIKVENKAIPHQPEVVSCRIFLIYAPFMLKIEVDK